MTTSHPPQDEQPHRAGYVPAFEGADGNEDPAPEAVVHAAPPAPIAAEVVDGRLRIAEDISVDRQTDAARRVGQLLLDFAEADTPSPPSDPATTVTHMLRTDAAPGAGADVAAARHPDHAAKPDAAQAGDTVCPECDGSGKTGAGLPCPHCGATGIEIRAVGDV